MKEPVSGLPLGYERCTFRVWYLLRSNFYPECVEQIPLTGSKSDGGKRNTFTVRKYEHFLRVLKQKCLHFVT